MKEKTVMMITSSMLDCECKGNGYVFLEKGGMIRCPIHHACASSEEYRLEMLRLEYQNLRKFVLQIPKMDTSFIDLNLPTTAKDVDRYIEETYDVLSPESWVQALQHFVRDYLINHHPQS